MLGLIVQPREVEIDAAVREGPHLLPRRTSPSDGDLVHLGIVPRGVDAQVESCRPVRKGALTVANPGNGPPRVRIAASVSGVGRRVYHSSMVSMPVSVSSSRKCEFM
jgi:hypothetical protein